MLRPGTGALREKGETGKVERWLVSSYALEKGDVAIQPVPGKCHHGLYLG